MEAVIADLLPVFQEERTAMMEDLDVRVVDDLFSRLVSQFPAEDRVFTGPVGRIEPADLVED